MFQKFTLSIALAASVALPLASSAEAAVGDGILSAGIPSIQIAPMEEAQFFFGGQNYCWYDAGWQGPGWYWCGYANRRGLGWGGGAGFHGWQRGGGRGGHGGHVGRPGGGHVRPGGGHGGHGGGHKGGPRKR